MNLPELQFLVQRLLDDLIMFQRRENNVMLYKRLRP